MPESELLNHFQCDIQCVLSNSENDHTNMKIILHKGKFIIQFSQYLENLFQECEKEKSWILT